MRDPPGSERTCWTLIQGAASGDTANRSEFSQRYLPVVRKFFSSRWRGSPLAEFVDDAVQEVFLECFRPQGVLESADPARPRGFRAFLFGVVSNVALRAERRRARQWSRRAPGSFHPEALPSNDEGLTRLFDREWAVSLIQQARERQEQRANRDDSAALRRVELLKLRFEEGLAIREIAARWNVDAESVQVAYRRARKEYRACLREVVAFHDPDGDDSDEARDEQCERLLALLH